MTAPDLVIASPSIPLGGDGPVFVEPWEAKVFAMTLQAHDAGLFSWPEWTRALGAELATDQPGTSVGASGLSYYEHWLKAFETLLAEKGVASVEALAELQKAWDEAAKATPHGEPIELNR